MNDRRIVLRTLSSAYARIEDPERWCQGNMRIGKSGREVQTIKAAVKCCAVGALEDWQLYPAKFYLDEAARLLTDRDGIISLNDSLGHDEVLRCYALASALVEARS